jgi:hypothetical protein
MLKRTLTITFGAVLLSALSTSSFAASELLDREKSLALFAGGSGKHGYLDHQKNYQFNWQSDGSVTVTRMNAKADDKPLAKGKWRIKEMEKKKGMSAGEVAAANDELSFVYCQQLDNMWSGHEHCWDVYQVSADMAKDKQPLPTQEYAFHREGGGEYNGFVITRR